MCVFVCHSWTGHTRRVMTNKQSTNCAARAHCPHTDWHDARVTHHLMTDYYNKVCWITETNPVLRYKPVPPDLSCTISCLKIILVYEKHCCDRANNPLWYFQEYSDTTMVQNTIFFIKKYSGHTTLYYNITTVLVRGSYCYCCKIINQYCVSFI